MITFDHILFFTFSTIMLGAALMVVVSRNSVKSALYLVLTFFSTACIWLMLEAEFLAIVLVLVYVGAVMVLFLFVVMMLDIDLAKMRAGFTRYLPLGSVIASLLLAEIILVLIRAFDGTRFAVPTPKSADYSNTRELGELLYTWYVYPFEIAALILLVAIIAAIALTLRRRPDSRYIDPGKQVIVKKEDRLRIIKMTAEKYAIVDDPNDEQTEGEGESEPEENKS